MTSIARKLHIGANMPTPGWETLNVIPLAGIDHVSDARDLSKFPDKTFEALYASHVLEHFDYKDEVKAVLVEWWRLLQPGGRIFISVPDLGKLCGLFLQTDRFDINDRFMIMRMMFGGHMDMFDYHQTAFNQEFLTCFMAEAGFEKITRVEEFSLFKDTSSLRYGGELISLNLTATRPGLSAL